MRMQIDEETEGIRYREGGFEMLCFVCRDWAKATITLGRPIEGIPEVGTAVIQLHADLTLHVHDHECMATRQLVDRAIKELRDLLPDLFGHTHNDN